MLAPKETAAFAGAGADVIRFRDAWVTRERIDAIHALGCECYIMANGEGLGYASAGTLADWNAWGAGGVLLNGAVRALAKD